MHVAKMGAPSRLPRLHSVSDAFSPISPSWGGHLSPMWPVDGGTEDLKQTPQLCSEGSTLIYRSSPMEPLIPRLGA